LQKSLILCDAGSIPRTAAPVTLSDDERKTLEQWVRCRKSEQRLAQRARIVLLAAGGGRNDEIARRLGTTAVTVSLWRGRFARGGLRSLADRPRSGAVPAKQRLQGKLTPTGPGSTPAPPAEGGCQVNTGRKSQAENRCSAAGDPLYGYPATGQNGNPSSSESGRIIPAAWLT